MWEARYDNGKEKYTVAAKEIFSQMMTGGMSDESIRELSTEARMLVGVQLHVTIVRSWQSRNSGHGGAGFA